jgi:hypothetical protein
MSDDVAATRTALRTVVWRDENHRPYAGTTGCYTEPPPWKPGTWEITRFEVLEGGAILHLWFAAIPASPR